jgi:hypothetical protein
VTESVHLVDINNQTDFAGDIDNGISAFSGTSREPRFVPAADGQSLLPVYDQIDQVGVDLQYTREAWLWKLEAIARDGYSNTFAAAVGVILLRHRHRRDLRQHRSRTAFR